MAITLPDLSGTTCLYLQTCGFLLKHRGKKVRKASPEYTTLIARYRSATGLLTYIRLVLSGDPIAHVHVDIARKEYFLGSVPPSTHKRKDILQTLALYRGEKLDLFVNASFVVLASALPAEGLILTGAPKLKFKDDEEIALTGARLSLKNATIDYIDWRSYDDFFSVDLSVNREEVLTDAYISEAFDNAKRAFKTYVLGTAPPSK
jgi:hypothetical protein